MADLVVGAEVLRLAGEALVQQEVEGDDGVGDVQLAARSVAGTLQGGICGCGGGA
jgi:hypothetical protein